MKPALETGISNLADASFKAFRLHQPVFQSRWHYHPELELVYFSQGKGMRFIGDDISLYKEGDLFLIGEGLPHTFVSYEEKPNWVEAYCIQFPKHIFDSFVECKALESLFHEAKTGIIFQNQREEMLEKFKAIVAKKGVTSLILLMELLETLTNTSDKNPILPQQYQGYLPLSNIQTRIQTAIDFINANYHRCISLQEMAEECHFSPNAFCRWFKQNRGLTFVDYLNKVRLTHVCQLLLATDLPIGQIATQTGFENISTLNRLFQQKLKTSPSRYRVKVGD